MRSSHRPCINRDEKPGLVYFQIYFGGTEHGARLTVYIQTTGVHLPAYQPVRLPACLAACLPGRQYFITVTGMDCTRVHKGTARDQGALKRCVNTGTDQRENLLHGVHWKGSQSPDLR